MGRMEPFWIAQHAGLGAVLRTNDTGQGVTPLQVLAWAAIVVAAGLIFFWPARTIAHVDDLFFIPWAAQYAATGEHVNSMLAVQFPGLADYHLYTRFHLILSGLFFDLAGVSRWSVVAFEYACYLLTAALFAFLCLTQRLPKAALFTPVLFAPMYVVTGFRPEISGCIFWMAGLALFFVAARIGETEGEGRKVSVLRTLARFLLAFAPLCAPAAFAWSLGAILTHDAWRLGFRQARLRTLFLENAVALAAGLLVFSLSIGFDYSEFARQFLYHMQRSTGGGMNDEAFGRAALFAGAALVAFRSSRPAALLCLMLAVGQALGGVFHDKLLIRNIAACMIFLVVAAALTRNRFGWVAYALYAAVFLVVSSNFLIFYVQSHPVGGAEDAVRDYRADVAAGKRVFIDETMAQQFLDQQTGGALSWTWGREFPLARAEELSELMPGDVWYLSPYTLYGYLKGRTNIAKALGNEVTYERTLQGPCVMGRLSCRLPVQRWGMLRLERDGGNVLVKDYAGGRTFPVPDGS